MEFFLIVARCMFTRSGCSDLFDFDTEVERILHACRRVNQVSASELISNSDSDYVFIDNSIYFDFEFDNHNMVEQRTLRELTALDMNYNALCIDYLDVVVPFELKFGLIHLLPRFNGLASEYPHNHLKELQVVYSRPLRHEGITEDHIKLRASLFSLKGVVKDWLYYLQPNSIAS